MKHEARKADCVHAVEGKALVETVLRPAVF